MNNPAMRVLHVVGPMNHGGAEVMIMELLRHKSPTIQMDFLVHHSLGYRVGDANFDAEILEKGARIIPIRTPTECGITSYFREFRKMITKHQIPDVIHIHLNARSGIVALAAWYCGVRRIIVHSHASLTFRGSLLYRILANIELLLSKIIFSFIVSDYWGCSRDAIASLFAQWPNHGKKRVVINNAINLKKYLSVPSDQVSKVRASLTGGRSGLLIGSVGRIVRHKNVALLIDIVDALRNRGVEVTLAIVGREADTNYCAEIRARAKHLNLSEAVRFIGPRDDIPAVMSALDVFVSPALREGFGLVGLESQAAGTPAVLSAGFPSIIDMNLDLVQVPSDYSPDVWADAILNSMDKKRPSLDDIAKVIAARGFSSEENTHRIEIAWRDRNYIPGELA